jgi:hypothetical protein
MRDVPLSSRPTQGTLLLHAPAGTLLPLLLLLLLLLLPDTAPLLLLLLLPPVRCSWICWMGTAQ